MKQLILASKSPRRIELIQKLGVEYRIVGADIDEVFDENLLPFENATETAREKAQNVFEQIDISDEMVVLGVDTIVVQNQSVIVKPKDRKDAFDILRKLSGNTHEVISGLAFISQEKIMKKHVVSLVEFADLSDEEINRYLDTQEPYDKAGAYGIQGTAGLFVKAIHGCYFNIMGLPLQKVYEILRDEFGFSFHWS